MVRVDFDSNEVAKEFLDRMPLQVLRLHLEHIKQNISYQIAYQYYGMGWLSKETHQIRCPFHGLDRNPSARYYADTQRMWCFACSDGGDVNWFFKKKEGFDYYEQVIAFVRDKFGIAMDELDLTKRQLLLQPKRVSPERKTFGDLYADRLNDILLRFRQAGAPRDLDRLEQGFWQEKSNIDHLECSYMEYCNLIRGWAKQCKEILQDFRRRRMQTTS